VAAGKHREKRRASKRERARIQLIVSVVMAATLLGAVALEVRHKVWTEGHAHVSFVMVWLLVLSTAWAGLELWMAGRKLLGAMRRPTKKGRGKR